MALYGAKVTRPFIGNIYEAAGGKLFGYSPLSDFASPPAATGVTMRFTKTRDAVYNYWFTADYAAAAAANVGVGFHITVDGVIVVRTAAVFAGGFFTTPQVAGRIFVPAGSEVIVNIDNPDSGDGTAVAAGLFFEGTYMKQSSAGREVGEVTMAPDLVAGREDSPNQNYLAEALMGAGW